MSYLVAWFHVGRDVHAFACRDRGIVSRMWPRTIFIMSVPCAFAFLSPNNLRDLRETERLDDRTASAATLLPWATK